MNNSGTVQLKKGNEGFAMLFSVLISSVLLSIGLSIFNLTIKELILSSSGRESQFSFYAADTGVECALYWNFEDPNPFAVNSSSPSPTTINCVGQDISLTPSISNNRSAETQFSLSIPAVSPTSCAIVKVTKTAPSVGGIITTVVDSRGYNTSCTDTSNPNRVERALKVTY
jgi:hypothetical protein